MKKTIYFIVLFVLLFSGCKTVKTKAKLTVDSTAVTVSEVITEEKKDIKTVFVVTDSLNSNEHTVTTIIELDTLKTLPFTLNEFLNMQAIVPVKKITRIETFKNSQKKIEQSFISVDKSKNDKKEIAKKEVNLKKDSSEKTTSKLPAWLWAIIVFFVVSVVISLCILIINKFNL